MRFYFYFLLLMTISINSFAVTFGARGRAGFLRISPILGYEQVQKNTPTPHTSNRVYYGLGIEFGPRLFSVELQGTQATDTESYDTTTIKNTSKRASIGFKSYFSLAGALAFYLRGGAQGKKITVDTTKDGVTTSTTSAFYVDPYVGSGLRIYIARVLNVSVGITAVFSDYPNKGETEYQTNLGIGLRF